MKNSNQKTALETVCCVDNPHVASESSAANEVRDVLSQILRDGAQKMSQAAIQMEIDEFFRIDPALLAKVGVGLSFVMVQTRSENSSLVLGPFGFDSLGCPKSDRWTSVKSSILRSCRSICAKIHRGTGAAAVLQRHQYERLLGGAAVTSWER